MTLRRLPLAKLVVDASAPALGAAGTRFDFFLQLMRLGDPGADKAAQQAIDPVTRGATREQLGRWTITASNHWTTCCPTPVAIQKAAIGARSNHASVASSRKSRCRDRGITISRFITHSATNEVGPPGSEQPHRREQRVQTIE